MDAIIEIFQYEWAWRALISSVLVGVMCGVLGCFIVLRNMSLIGDALSHAILPGVVVGFVIAGYSLLAFFIGSVIAGLITAVLITWIQRNVKSKDDAAVGIVFTAMFSLGVMGISKLSREQGVHLDLKDFLFGNVLGISNEDLILTAIITVYVVGSIILLYRYFFATTFQAVVAETMGISVSMIHYFLMLLLSFSVVASLQSVGVILVVAMLIIPASTAYLLTNRLQIMLVISAIVGAMSAVLGLFFSVWLETTPGPAMTITGTLIYVIAVFFAPDKGLIRTYFRKRNKRTKIQKEDLLKYLAKDSQNAKHTLTEISKKLGIPVKDLKKAKSRLISDKLLEKSSLSLTKAGKKKGMMFIRAHRLMETYLVEKMGMSEDQIHQMAEEYEHVLPEQILDAVEEKLGFPKTDPHGSPIPQKNYEESPVLFSLKIKQKAQIIKSQSNKSVLSELWEMNIPPNKSFIIKEKTTEFVFIQIEEVQYKLPINLAKKVEVEV